jgi:hypothetical protein
MQMYAVGMQSSTLRALPESTHSPAWTGSYCVPSSWRLWWEIAVVSYWLAFGLVATSANYR